MLTITSCEKTSHRNERPVAHVPETCVTLTTVDGSSDASSEHCLLLTVKNELNKFLPAAGGGLSFLTSSRYILFGHSNLIAALRHPRGGETHQLVPEEAFSGFTFLSLFLFL